MSMLRDPEHGCPWDRKQTFHTIASHTLEEVYEVVDTIERNDYDHLANELGDLLFQIVFYAQLGKESGYFDFEDIVEEIGRKLLTRHPHVFPQATMESFGSQARLSPEQVEQTWEKIKQAERDSKGYTDQSVLADVPAALPGLTRARKVQKRAASNGFDWPETSGVLEKIREEFEELAEVIETSNQDGIEDELGDLFFSLVNLSRHVDVEPERCLRRATNKFEDRFRALEEQVEKDGETIHTLSIEELEERWQAIKQDKKESELNN